MAPTESPSPESSLHNHAPGIECAACARALSMVSSRVAGSLLFSVAADEWIVAQALYLRPSTIECYRDYLKPLNEFFGALPVREIHIGHVRSYQEERSKKVSGRVINAGMRSAFIPILRASNCWKHLADQYKRLPEVDERVRQNMDEEEERRLIAIALDASHPRRLLAGHCLIVMYNVGFGFGELRYLRRKDVVFDVQYPFVTTNAKYVKNKFRVRTVPMNWLALRSMRWIVHRWEDLGGTDPEQYILPHAAKRTPEERKTGNHRRTHPPDFTRPMDHIYRAARAILKEAGLGHMDPYDMRSTFITKIMNNPEASDQMVKEITGRSRNSRVNDRYSNQQLAKKAVVTDKLAIDPEPRIRLIAFPGGRR